MQMRRIAHLQLTEAQPLPEQRSPYQPPLQF